MHTSCVEGKCPSTWRFGCLHKKPWPILKSLLWWFENIASKSSRHVQIPNEPRHNVLLPALIFFLILTELIIYRGKDSPSMPHQAADASWLMVIHALCCFIFHFHMVQQSSPTSYKDLIHLWRVLGKKQWYSVEYWLAFLWNLPTNWRKNFALTEFLFSL